MPPRPPISPPPLIPTLSSPSMSLPIIESIPLLPKMQCSITSFGNQPGPPPMKNALISNSSMSQPKSNNIYIDIISAQLTQGYWEYQSISQLLPKINNIPQDLLQISENLKLNALCTVFVLVYLHKNYSEKHEEWELVERKANKWLKSIQINYENCKQAFSSYV
ncbi:hypothetical protein SteCoe_37815 [Stentor coeruleus]|uniref:Uncharacterized protein n=1 Tax=Stentor coeruleus TaxID=5963 RepID=A0A1R2AMN1_9CILI|nr:hypothetical protein SteCoe_37815 [Stentor coeruleus]